MLLMIQQMIIGEQKYAYAFIEGFLTNAVVYGDDGAARDAFMKDYGGLAWIVYSKIASIQETAEITKKNITIAALGKDISDGANPGDSKAIPRLMDLVDLCINTIYKSCHILNIHGHHVHSLIT